MSELKLVALDEEDLKVVSAHVQDAVMKVGDLAYDARRRLFVAKLNRFVWERRRGWFSSSYERRRAVLDFGRVMAVSSTGIDKDRPEDVLSLLALEFEPGDAPEGTVAMLFSGGATIRLEVECLEVRLADVGAAWETRSVPRHRA